MTDAAVVELVEVRDLPLDVPGSRSLLVRWSDGTTSEAVRFYADEILFSEGDLVGKTQAEVRALLQRRDVEFVRGDWAIPRHAREFQSLARLAGIDLAPEVRRPWLTPRGHLDDDVAASLDEDARLALDGILDALGGDPDILAAKRRGSMRVDFMTEAGLIVEYDEVQHFTSARLKTLDLYPPGAALGFNLAAYRGLVERWKPKGDRAFAYKTAVEFPGPAGRQRQRAYFDAFRDLAAPTFEAGSLIRIPCPDDNYADGVRRLTRALAVAGSSPPVAPDQPWPSRSGVNMHVPPAIPRGPWRLRDGGSSDADADPYDEGIEAHPVCASCALALTWRTSKQAVPTCSAWRRGSRRRTYPTIGPLRETERRPHVLVSSGPATPTGADRDLIPLYIADRRALTTRRPLVD